MNGVLLHTVDLRQFPFSVSYIYIRWTMHASYKIASRNCHVMLMHYSLDLFLCVVFVCVLTTADRMEVAYNSMVYEYDFG